MPKRRLKGVVASDKMDKTIVVSVDQIKEHPKYKKRYRLTTRYKAHDEENLAKEGDTVVIEETRPMSRDKRWRLVKEER